MPTRNLPCELHSPANWRGPEIGARSDWQYRLSAVEVQEVEHALQHFAARRVDLLESTQADFPLPTLGPKLRMLLDQLERSYGLLLIRGLPLTDKSAEQGRLIAWGIGMYLGVALPQNDNADIIVDVRDQGYDSTVTLRGNSSKDPIRFHVDPCDVVGLLCRRGAREGGLSLVTSSLTVHNEIARRRPDLLRVLYQPFPFIKLAKNESIPFYMSPIFGFQEGHFTSQFYAKRIYAAAELPGAPRLTAAQCAAIELVEEIAADPALALQMRLESGDLQLLSNHVIYHSRTGFSDHEEADHKRHLYRLWFATYNSRPLPLSFDDAYNGSTEPGTLRGGYLGWKFPEKVGPYQQRLSRTLGLTT